MTSSAAASLFLLVGLPGAGKTTRAQRLAVQRQAVRLTPDEWMIPLFGESDAGGKRDVLEGRFLTLALQLLRLAASVVLDFGCWSRAERSAIRALAGSTGAAFALVYLPIDRDTQLARIGRRWSDAPSSTFVMTAEDVDRWRAMFEEPSPAELRGIESVPVPAGYADWIDWARTRWPSFEPG